MGSELKSRSMNKSDELRNLWLTMDCLENDLKAIKVIMNQVQVKQNAVNNSVEDIRASFAEIQMRLNEATILNNSILTRLVAFEGMEG